MGHNRAGEKRKLKIRRRRREEMRLKIRSHDFIDDLIYRAFMNDVKEKIPPDIREIIDSAIYSVIEDERRTLMNPYKEIGKPTGQRPVCPGCRSLNTFTTAATPTNWRCDTCYITFNNESVRTWVKI